MTLSELINQEGITLSAVPADSNPNMDLDVPMTHWRVTLRSRHGRRMALPFSQGYGWAGTEPQVIDVLDCLAADASAVENARSFEDWASDYGFDADSRKAERLFRASAKQTARLKEFMGDAAFNSLLWDVQSE